MPSGISYWKPSLQQNVIGGEANYVSEFSNSSNTGGGLNGLLANDFTGASGLPDADNADLVTGAPPPTNNESDLAPIVVTATKIPTNPDGTPLSASAQSQNGNGGAVGAFVASPVGVDVAVAAATCPVCVLIAGALLPSTTASDDTISYVFHFTSSAAAASILSSGQVIPGSASGVTWVTPTPYPTANLALTQLALPAIPDGFLAIPAQNLQGPVSWSTVQPRYSQPGGGVEGTTPYPIPVTGAVWVPFH